MTSTVEEAQERFKVDGTSDITAIPRKEAPMLYYALAFLVVGLIAGILGLSGIAAVASQISWILFLVGIVLLVIHMVTGRPAHP